MKKYPRKINGIWDLIFGRGSTISFHHSYSPSYTLRYNTHTEKAYQAGRECARRKEQIAQGIIRSTLYASA